MEGVFISLSVVLWLLTESLCISLFLLCVQTAVEKTGEMFLFSLVKVVLFPFTFTSSNDGARRPSLYIDVTAQLETFC